MLSSLSDKTKAAIDSVATEAATTGRIRSLAFGIVIGGDLTHAGSAGAPGTNDVTADETTVFRIASMTKSFTAAAVLRARDRGMLSLDDKLADWVPQAAGWKLPTTDSPAITLQHLISMSSGIVSDDPWADRHMDMPADEFSALLTAQPRFAFVPGETFQYSNLGFAILGRAFQQATGRRLQEYVTTELLQPLAMTSTFWQLDQLPTGCRVVDGWHTIDGEWVAEPTPLDDGSVAPMGGLWSTVADLSRWISFWCDAWPARDGDEGILSRASRREAQHAHTDMSRLAPNASGRVTLGYGCGLRIMADPRVGRVVDHSGGLPGFGSNMRWVPELGIGVIGLANERYAWMDSMTNKMLDVLIDSGELPAPPPRRSDPLNRVFETLVGLLNRWDDAIAERLFADNVALDHDLARRQAQAAALIRKHGTLRLGAITAISQARGTAALYAGEEVLTLEVLMSVHDEPQIQHYSMQEQR